MDFLQPNDESKSTDNQQTKPSNRTHYGNQIVFQILAIYLFSPGSRLVENFCKPSAKQWQPVSDHIPNDIGINGEILMDQYVS